MGWLWIGSSSEWAWLVNTIARIDRNLNTVANNLSVVTTNLTTVTNRLNKMEISMSALDDAIVGLTTQVTANTSAEQSAVTLIQELASMIGANATDPAAVTALADRMKASADALAAAITANTPAAPVPAA